MLGTVIRRIRRDRLSIARPFLNFHNFDILRERGRVRIPRFLAIGDFGKGTQSAHRDGSPYLLDLENGEVYETDSAKLPRSGCVSLPSGSRSVC